MVEIETSLGDQIEKEVDSMSPQDVIRSQVCKHRYIAPSFGWQFTFCLSFQTLLRRVKYKLFACFYEATMVAETDGPVEFEVSIGKHKYLIFSVIIPSDVITVMFLFTIQVTMVT